MKGVRYPWMSWEEVRSLHERGFDDWIAHAHARRSRIGRARQSRRRNSRRAARSGTAARRNGGSLCVPVRTAGQHRRGEQGSGSRGWVPLLLLVLRRRGRRRDRSVSPHAHADLVSPGLARTSSASSWRSAEASRTRRGRRAAKHWKQLDADGGDDRGHLFPHAVRHPHARHGGIRNLDAHHVDDRLHQPAGARRTDGVRAISRTGHRRRRCDEGAEDDRQLRGSVSDDGRRRARRRMRRSSDCSCSTTSRPSSGSAPRWHSA